ncbi:TIGR04104 family putative zinc finger protein [Alkalihalobacillus sp. FSL W8-0930]
MPTCNHCGAQWTWWQTLKRSFTISPGMPCPKCEKEQFVTKRSKKKSGLLGFIFPLMLPIVTMLQVPVMLILFIYPSLFLLLISLYPFLIEFSNEEEFMF